MARRARLKLQSRAIAMLADRVQWAQLLLEVLRELLLLLSQHCRNGPILVGVLLQLVVRHRARGHRTRSNWMDITLESPLSVWVIHLIKILEAVRPLDLSHLTVGRVTCVLCGAAARLERVRPARMQLLVRLSATSRWTDAAIMGALAIILHFVLHLQAIKFVWMHGYRIALAVVRVWKRVAVRVQASWNPLSRGGLLCHRGSFDTKRSLVHESFTALIILGVSQSSPWFAVGARVGCASDGSWLASLSHI